jgi:dissimilatory sulfite reductase related protein
MMDVDIDMPQRDAEGYLIEPGDWSEDVARALAREENIELSDDHWDAINFMRDFYEENQVAADARFVIKHLAERMGKDAHKKLFELFPTATSSRPARSPACAGRAPGARARVPLPPWHSSP